MTRLPVVHALALAWLMRLCVLLARYWHSWSGYWNAKGVRAPFALVVEAAR